MTEEEIEACRLAFEKFDADGSGTIEANELKVTRQSMGQNPTRLPQEYAVCLASTLCIVFAVPQLRVRLMIEGKRICGGSQCRF